MPFSVCSLLQPAKRIVTMDTVSPATTQKVLGVRVSRHQPMGLTQSS